MLGVERGALVDRSVVVGELAPRARPGPRRARRRGRSGRGRRGRRPLVRAPRVGRGRSRPRPARAARSSVVRRGGAPGRELRLRVGEVVARVLVLRDAPHEERDAARARAPARHRRPARRRSSEERASATRRLLQARERGVGRVGRGAHRRGLRFQVGERGVARRLERAGEVGVLRVVVLVDGLVGDVDRVVARVDLGLLGGEERGERLVGRRAPRAATAAAVVRRRPRPR